VTGVQTCALPISCKEECSCKEKDYDSISLLAQINIDKLSTTFKELNTIEDSVNDSLNKIPQLNISLSNLFDEERQNIVVRSRVPIPNDSKPVFYSLQELENYIEEQLIVLGVLVESYAIIQADIKTTKEKLQAIMHKVQNNKDIDDYKAYKEYNDLRLFKVIAEYNQTVSKLNKQLESFRPKEDDRICRMCEKGNIGRIVLKCGHRICVPCAGSQKFSKSKEVVCYLCGGIKRMISIFY
jgi:hypothetical protein